MKKTYYVFLSIICFFIAHDVWAQTNKQKFWVFFRDKDPALVRSAEFDAAYRQTLVSERSLQRRQKSIEGSPVQFSDVPVAGNYIEKINELGIKPIVISKWLNAASVWLNSDQLNVLLKYEFVKNVQPVRRLSVPKPITGENVTGIHPSIKTAKDLTEKYGSSYSQNNSINAIDLHQAGITGRGILIGVIDTGYQLFHEALKNVDVVAEYDFIYNDTLTAYDPGQDRYPFQDDHGTATFSVIGAYKEGQLIGVAHTAQFVLAKTENESSETPVEEDFWVAAVEWMDSIGVDIISSSLGYSTFDDPRDDYSISDMDGNTAVTTIAADMAVSKGIVVVASAGNEGTYPWKIITAPADGDSVIAVGAATYDKKIASFSSRGPTADGRIKPDVVALGIGVYGASSDGYDSYGFFMGTSLSCPLTAGAAALILSSHPELNPMDVMTAFKQTADRYDNPDNTYGWGFIDAFAAVTYFGPAFSNSPSIEITAENYVISTHIISSAGVDESSPHLVYSTGYNAVKSTVPLVETGEETKYTAAIPLQPDGTQIYICFFAQDVRGQYTIFPNETVGLPFVFTAGQSSIQHPGRRDKTKTWTIPERIVLSNNYPNPFNNRTIIPVELPEATKITLTIYDILGNRIRLIYDGIYPPGMHSFSWDGTSSAGVPVPSGVYFCRMIAGSTVQTRKMLLFK